MRRSLTIVTVVLVAVTAQLAAVSRLRVHGVAPDIVVLAVAAIAARAGSETGALSGFGAGLLIDLFLPSPAGLSALSYALVGYGIGLLAAGLLDTPWWTAPAVGGVAALGSGVIYTVAGGLLGQTQLLEPRVVFIVVMGALLSAAMALVVVPPVRRIVPTPRVARSDPW